MHRFISGLFSLSLQPIDALLGELGCMAIGCLSGFGNKRCRCIVYLSFCVCVYVFVCV